MIKIETSCSKEAEMAVLGAMIISQVEINSVKNVLNDNDFYFTVNQTIFSAMCEMDKAGSIVDLVTLTDYLKSNDKLSYIGGETYLSELMEKVSSVAHVMHYAKIVRDKSLVRKRNMLAKELENAKGDDVSDILEKIKQTSIERKNKETVHIKDVCVDFVQDLERPISIIKTGFPSIDDNMMLERGELFVVGGRPEAGKSILCQNIFNNLVNNGLKVMYFTTEMSPAQTIRRLAIINTNIPMKDFKNKNISASSAKEIAICMSKFSSKNVYFFNSKMPNIKDVEKAIDRIKPDVCILDQINSCDVGGVKKGNYTYAVIDFINKFNEVVYRNNCLGILASQARRELTDSGKRPTSADFSDSRGIEQTVKGGIILWKDVDLIEKQKNHHGFDFANNDLISCAMVKNRDGQKKDFHLTMSVRNIIMKEHNVNGFNEIKRNYDFRFKG